MERDLRQLVRFAYIQGLHDAASISEEISDYTISVDEIFAELGDNPQPFEIISTLNLMLSSREIMTRSSAGESVAVAILFFTFFNMGVMFFLTVFGLLPNDPSSLTLLICSIFLVSIFAYTYLWFEKKV